jgi:hypothetical protein
MQECVQLTFVINNWQILKYEYMDKCEVSKMSASIGLMSLSIVRNCNKLVRIPEDGQIPQA